MRGALIGLVLGAPAPGAGQERGAPPATNWAQMYPQRYGLSWGQVVVLTGCIIGGRSYPGGTPDPENECRICQPGLDLFNWTAAPADNPCEGGGYCGTAGVGCVAAESPGLIEEFVGNPWEVTNVDTIQCSDGSQETTPPGVALIAFTSPRPDRIRYWSPLGCAFVFNVHGPTATLSNGPVTCVDRNREITVTGYSATINQDRSMTLSSESSELFSDGVTCTVASSGTASR